MSRRLFFHVALASLLMVALVASILLSGFNSRVSAAAPTITAVSPNQGNQGQINTHVIISGTDLTAATSLSFGSDVTISSFTVNSPTEISVSIFIGTSATPGVRDVSVTTPGGTATKAAGFTVVAKGGATGWTTKAPLAYGYPYSGRITPVVITGDDGLIYVIGGAGPSGWEEPIYTTEAYDPVTDTWTTKADILWSTYNGAAGAKGLDGTIYIIGGNWYDATLNQAYDPQTDTWSLRAPTLWPVRFAGAATGNDGKIYVIGGNRGMPCDCRYVQAYDPATDTWSERSPMSVNRRELAVVKGSDGLIYAIGGWRYNCNGDWGQCTGYCAGSLWAVEAYDPATDTWTTKAPLPSSNGLRLINGSATLGPDGKIYVVGGQPWPSAISSDVYSYDIATDTWTVEPSMPTARCSLGVATANGGIYAIGGTDYSGCCFEPVNEELLFGTTPSEGAGGGRGVPAFPSMYVGVGAAFAAGILAYFIRRGLISQR